MRNLPVLISVVVALTVTVSAADQKKSVKSFRLAAKAIQKIRAYLGTIPDYAVQVKGVKLKGVVKGGPAHKAGILAGDIVVEMGEHKITGLRDYVQAVKALKVGEEIEMVVLRKGKRLVVDVEPVARP
ncbi:MAG: PDZ domain-containing protein [Planctomycetaceae bacterium]